MATFSESNDTIATATLTGLSSDNFGVVSFSGAIGDNPNIDPELDVDLFEVQLDQGDRLVIDVDTRAIGSSLDSTLRLFNSSGDEVSRNDDSDGLDSLINFTSAASDTYFIGVSGYDNIFYAPFIEGSGYFGSTGEYTIEIELGSSPPPVPSFPSGSSASNRDLSSLVDSINGFVLNGIDVYDFSGISVSGAGDINGDGFDDLIIGASPYGYRDRRGASYIVFGSSGFKTSLELSELDGTKGFVLNGNDRFGRSGRSVSRAGDINGDGLDDLIIGAPDDFYSEGKSYVVFGSSRFNASLELADLDGTNGFVLNGINRFGRSGYSVSGAGDINGDGLDDLIIGAPDAGNLGSGYYKPYDDSLGESYVVFGSSRFDASLELADLDGTNGFVLNGIDGRDRSGFSVSGAGDINGDGLDDLIIGAPYAGNPGSGYYNSYDDNRGESYVVFGSNNGFEASLELSELDGTNGFVLNGIDAGNNSGRSVSGAGDINGDGIDDLIIGAPSAGNIGTGYFFPYDDNRGESYVVFGSSGFDASLELSDLDGTNGFVLRGIDAGDRSGFSVSGAGDTNGDGFDDLIIGAPYARTLFSSYYNSYLIRPGESYVVFGSNRFDASLELAELNGTNGFVLKGIDSGDYSGRSVSGAGDINGDGMDDLIIGAPSADPNGKDEAGESYVVFGALQLTGTEDDDFLLDDNDDDAIFGLGGNDTIAGLAGDDEISGGDGDDVLRGDLNSRSPGGTDGGNDTLFGGAGNDRLGGKGGDDFLLGNSGDDRLYGDDGDDVLLGNSGDDMLQGDDFSGGQGQDVFVLARGEGTDTIIDFEVGTDFIGLESLRLRDISISGTDNALVNFQDETLAIVQGVSPDSLNALSFFRITS